MLLPANLAGLRVERVEVLVLGADVDGRVGLRRVGDRGRRVDPVAGRVAPEQLAGVLVERVDAAVDRAQVDAPEGDRRGRVDGPAAAEAEALGARLPDVGAARGAQREHLAGVVGAVEDAVVERQPALDRAGGVHLPVGLAGLAIEREDVARLAADDHVGCRRRSARSRCARGAGSARAACRPWRASPAPRPRRRRGALQGDRVDHAVRVGGGGGAETADVLLPLDLALVGAERVEERVLVLEVERALGDDRRELEQLAGLKAPLGGVEGRLHPLRRQVAGALRGRSRRAASRRSRPARACVAGFCSRSSVHGGGQLWSDRA